MRSPRARAAIYAAALLASVPAARARAEDAQGAFGTGDQVLIVQAEQFTGRQTLSAGDLAWSTEGYYSSSASMTPSRYFAPLQLPAGAVITGFQCFVRDSSMPNNATFFLWERNHDVVMNFSISNTFASMASTGVTGYQQPSTTLMPPYTVRYANGNNRYVLLVSADLAVDTFLRECRITWHRSVSPAPATATFNDVPVGHPIRQFVEAMAASGITGGCGSGNYCPDAPLTRGQMAVFLSVALGLHWPQ